MALTETSNQLDKKPDTHKDKGSEKKEKLPTKVIIRRLPPTMDQETFLNQISPVPSYDYLYMVRGDMSLGENAFSRAYINFMNPTDVFDFKEKFDNYVFLDNAGHEYPAVVEFAAFQKIPKKRNKIRIDHKSGTIETDPYYLEFIEILNKPPEQEEKPEYSYQLTTESKNDLTTPLLEFVKNKRAERLKIREERREERKRKEFERKKYRDDIHKKSYNERSPAKPQFPKTGAPKEKSGLETEKREKEDAEKSETLDEKSDKYDKPFYKTRDRKFEDRKKDVRAKYPPKKEFLEKREYKNRRDDYKERDYRNKYDDHKKDDTKIQQKKVKKYSEKREERRIEAQKAEQRKIEQQNKDLEQSKKEPEAKVDESKPILQIDDSKKVEQSDKREEFEKSDNKNLIEKDAVNVGDNSSRNKEKENQQKRIRNKDRPTLAIYRPGMLSKRKHNDGDSENKDSKKD